MKLRQQCLAVPLMGLMLICATSVCGCGAGKVELAKSVTNAGDFIEKTTEKGPVKLIVRVSPKAPRLSDLVEVDAQVVVQPGVEIHSPTFGQATGDFLVRDYGERKGALSKNSTSDGPSTHHFRYQLEPTASGRHLIRSIAIEFVDQRATSEQKGSSGLIESEPIELNITSELGDQVPNLNDLEPMLPPRPVDQSASMTWVLVAIAAVIIAAGLIWFLLRKKSVDWQPPEQTPQEIAHAAFKALMSENLPARGQFKEFYVRLTGIVRYFIEGTTGLRAPEQTTEEFLAEMRTREVFSANQSVRLKEFLEAADMVKYAGQQPDQTQVEHSIDRAKEFVDFHEAPVGVSNSDSQVPQKV